jgi:PAS domain S-box-containing protein
MLTIALCMLTLIVLLEWYSELDYSLGVLYVLPILVAATVLGRIQIFLAAVLCALVRDVFHPPMTLIESTLRFVMAVLAYSGAGLLVVETMRSRKIVLAHYAQLKLEKDLRQRVEEQLRVLADSSPAAILTVDYRGNVLAANRSAHEMLGYDEPGSLIGENIRDMLPIFANALRLSPGSRPVRTSASSWAKRRSGEVFPIMTWFSTYGIGEQRCLAAIIVDTSEEVRDRERENFRHFLDYNRLLAGTVSHEIRNMCSAISVVCANLDRRPDLRGDADFQALNSLVSGLSRIASFELRNRAEEHTPHIQIQPVLDHLRVVIEPDWTDINGTVKWSVPDNFPEVHADSYGLLQVFLNLAQNSLRAVAGCERRELEISLSAFGKHAVISFIDSGPGVIEPENLFHPFRPGSDGSGLGLYISRALVRSFGGDLVYVPSESGCRFDVILEPVRHAGTLPANASDLKQTHSPVPLG